LGQKRPAVKWDIELLEFVYTHSHDRVVQSEIEKVVAESADGDTAAAHIAFGSDFLCSEDRGRTAGARSIFDAANRAWLKAAYGVNFVNIPELAALIDAGAVPMG
jgi:hypothetical protein